MEKIFKKSFLICFLTIFAGYAYAQGPVFSYNQGNAALKTQSAKQQRFFGAIASITTDTLDLPFFDDFAYDEKSIYPDSRLWIDNYVYINNNFTKNQLTRGVATFDHLNPEGNPYGPLSRYITSVADTMTTQSINLQDRVVGANTVAYTLADSIYLSFFIQSGGLGDAPDAQDSIALYFLDNTGNWNSVWQMIDNAAPDFTQFLIGINDSKYLHKSFQFRFINYIKNSGNMNHYHLDYVRMNFGRSMNDTMVQDVAFSKNPLGLLNRYAIMPYDHFKTNPSSWAAPNREIYFRNNFKGNSVFVSAQSEAFDDANTSINLIPFASSSNINVPAYDEQKFSYNAFPINTLSGDSPSIKFVYGIQSPGVNDATEKNDYNSIFNNNNITFTQKFNHLYAYDDGSAETSFGLDYSSLPNGPGYVAIKYSMAKTDTFRGWEVFFNQALEDVSFKPIYLTIWQDIANGNGKVDKKIYSILTTPRYSGQINGFSRFEIDTAIILPAGDFYIGWQQNSKFFLNIGWDENYADAKSYQPEIYYDLLGSWEQLPSSFKGVLMMRPLIGKQMSNLAAIEKAIENWDAQVFPNPSNGNVKIESKSNFTLKVYDLFGKLVFENDVPTNLYQLNLQNKGMYVCILNNENNQTITKKIIIQ